jgi:hypothetical protein
MSSLVKHHLLNDHHSPELLNTKSRLSLLAGKDGRKKTVINLWCVAQQETAGEKNWPQRIFSTRGKFE